MKRKLLIFLSALLFINAAQAQFTSGNIAAMVVAASATNTTASIIEISPSIASSTPANTYPINGTSGSDAMRFSGSATSTCYLANTADGSLLCFAGANTSTTTSNTNTITTRAVGAFNAAGNYSIQTTYTGSSGNQPRSATAIDNSSWYIGDQGGIYSNTTTTASPSGNFRACKAFGSNVYVSASSSTSTIIQLNTISAATSGTITPLPGLTNNGSIQDYYLIQSGNNGSTYDVLYILSATSNTAGTIQKYSLVAGNWVSNGTFTTTFGGFGLAASTTSTGAYLFLSTGAGAQTANSILRLTDDSSYNATLSINAANNLTLYTAPTGTIIKGVAFAPTSPLSIHLIDIAAKKISQQNLIQWNTGNEDEGDYFELMHSADGKRFSKISIINGKGSNSQYSYYDEQPFDGTNYYQLKMVDLNGNVNLSKIVSVKAKNELVNEMNIAPNPIVANELHLSFLNNLNGNFELTITNAFGQLVSHKTLQFSATNNLIIAMPELVSGNIYFVKLSNGAENYIQKFFVK